jgi:uncharacterized RDD family membrane protein YckC
MAEVLLPAPLWRRLAAAAYDALLLAAIWMVTSMLDALVWGLAGVPHNVHVLRGELLLAGLAFFGWFWTHGGQTLGMRAWRLRLRRADGGAIGWTTALSRYAFAWLAWLPLGLGVLASALDPQRRAWHDRLSGTEIILLAKD